MSAADGIDRHSRDTLALAARHLLPEVNVSIRGDGEAVRVTIGTRAARTFDTFAEAVSFAMEQVLPMPVREAEG